MCVPYGIGRGCFILQKPTMIRIVERLSGYNQN
nr:MAG TPA: hypothetical protein [Bacteriophage sp.]